MLLKVQGLLDAAEVLAVALADGREKHVFGRRTLPQMDLASGDKEHLTELYYNLRLTDRLRLSFTGQHVLDAPADGVKFGYFLPGLRLQASF